MKIQTKEEGDVVVVFVKGGILQENVDDFQTTLNTLLKKGHLKLVLDMEHCNYITSMSLAVITSVKKQLMKVNGDIKLANINRLISNLFKVTNLKKKIEIFKSVSAAIEAF